MRLSFPQKSFSASQCLMRPAETQKRDEAPRRTQNALKPLKPLNLASKKYVTFGPQNRLELEETLLIVPLLLDQPQKAD
jgi:hypothetical protein